MERVLFLTHTEADGGLSRASLETLGAASALARGLGAELAAALFGADVQAAADKVADCGAVKFFGVSGPDFGQARYGSDAAAMEALVRTSGATVVVAPADSRMSRALAGAAHRLGGRLDAQVTAVEAESGAPVVTRWYYRQRIFAQQSREHRPWFITVAPGCVQAYAGAGGSAQVEAVAVELSDALRRTTVAGVQAPSGDEQTIRPDAALLFVSGAGWTKKQADGQAHVKEAEAIIKQFLDRSGASLGSSKSLVDLSGEGQEVISFLSHLHQVGQTGSTPRHAKGLATCCHGEEPHVVGWRFISERRAVNLDPACGWAQGKADVLYVADAFEVMRKVNELLTQR